MRADEAPEVLSRSRSSTDQSAGETIAVIEERLAVTKRVVESGGGIRLRKIVHRDVTNVTEPLALETLEVKRLSVGREIDGPVPIRYEGDVTVIPIIEERLVTRKQLVLVEEIHVTKVSRVASADQRITLRREQIIAERQDPISGEWSIISPESDLPTSTES